MNVDFRKAYRFVVNYPGMTKEDFNIRIDEDNQLIVSMEKKQENKEENNSKKAR